MRFPPSVVLTLSLVTCPALAQSRAPVAAPLQLTRPAAGVWLDPTRYDGVDGIMLHVESNRPWSTYVYRAAAAGPSVGWDRLCSAPCDRAVDPKGLYRIGGPTVADSDEFHLPSRPAQTLYVDASSSASKALAIGAIGLGAVLAVPGALFFEHSTADGSNKIVGGVLLLNGLPWLITGVVMLASGTSTTVKDDRGRKLARAVSGTVSF
jgi:hypothetical protein